MIAVFILNYILTVLGMIYKVVWWAVTRKKNKVVNLEDEYPKYTHEEKDRKQAWLGT